MLILLRRRSGERKLLRKTNDVIRKKVESKWFSSYAWKVSGLVQIG